jgi:hypothetical protein
MSQRDIIRAIEFDILPNVRQAAPAQAAEPQRQPTNILRDIPGALVSGVGGLGTAAGGIYGLATGDFDNAATRTGRYVQEVGRDIMSPGLRQRQEEFERRLQGVQNQGLGTQAVEAVSGLASDPYLFGSMAVEQIPQLAASLGVGRVGSAVGQVAARRAGAEAAEQAARRGATGAAIGTSTGLQTGEVANSTYQDVMTLTSEVIERSPAYQELRRTMTDQEARVTLATQAAREASAIAAPLSAASATLLPGVERMAFAQRAQQAALSRILGGAIFEGGQEAIEEGGGRFAQNVGARRADAERDLGQGVGSSAATGAALGAGAGAGFAALRGGPPPTGLNQDSLPSELRQAVNDYVANREPMDAGQNLLPREMPSIDTPAGNLSRSQLERFMERSLPDMIRDNPEIASRMAYAQTDNDRVNTFLDILRENQQGNVASRQGVEEGNIRREMANSPETQEAFREAEIQRRMGRKPISELELQRNLAAAERQVQQLVVARQNAESRLKAIEAAPIVDAVALEAVQAEIAQLDQLIAGREAVRRQIANSIPTYERENTARQNMLENAGPAFDIAQARREQMDQQRQAAGIEIPSGSGSPDTLPAQQDDTRAGAPQITDQRYLLNPRYVNGKLVGGEEVVEILPSDNFGNVLAYVRRQVGDFTQEVPVETTMDQLVQMPVRESARMTQEVASALVGPEDVAGQKAGRAVDAEGQTLEPRRMVDRQGPEASAREVGGEQAQPEAQPTESDARAGRRVAAQNRINAIYLDKLKAKGKQGKLLRSALVNALKDRTLTSEQVYAAFVAAEVMSQILPATADHQVLFARELLASDETIEKSGGVAGQKVQGLRTRPNQPGILGLIQLSLAENQLPFLRETAAHEAFHVLQDYYGKYDPQFAKLMSQGFRDDMKISDVDPTIRRKLEQARFPNLNKSYWDVLTSSIKNKMTAREAQAYAFGALMDASKRGVPMSGMKPAFTRFVNAMRQFFDRMGNKLRGDGFQTVEDVLGRVAKGDASRFNDQATPTGQDFPSAETEASARQIETPEFRRWFGDSKVVDEGGKPLVVYHGTRAHGFDTFRPNIRKNEQLGFGIHFSESEDFARLYAEDDTVARRGKSSGMYSVYLSIKNPLNAAQIVYEGSPEFMLAEKLAGKKLYTSKDADGRRAAYLQNAIDGTSPQRAEKLIKDAGYDGVIYNARVGQKTPYNGAIYRGESRSFIVFEPSQIKSATSNSGGFNPNNPNIEASARSPLFEGEQADQELSPSQAEASARATNLSVPEFTGWWNGGWKEGSKKKASAARERDGSPKRYYHGTIRNFTAFGGASSGALEDREGPFFFTPEPSFTDDYVDGTNSKSKSDLPTEGQRVLPVFLSVQNPFNTSDRKRQQEITQFLRDVLNSGRLNFSDILPYAQGYPLEQAVMLGEMTRQEALEEAFSTWRNTLADPDISWRAIEAPMVQKYIRGNGFDSFYITENGVKNLAVYDPRQIKSIFNDFKEGAATSLEFSARSPLSEDQAYQSAAEKITGKELDKPNVFSDGMRRFVGALPGEKLSSALVRTTINRAAPLWMLDRLAKERGLSLKSAGLAMEVALNNSGRVQMYMEHGPLAYDPNTGNVSIREDVPGLIDVIKGRLNVQDKKEAQSYLVALREQDLRRNGKKGFFNLTDAEVNAIISKAEAAHPEWKEMAADIQRINKALLDFAVNTGTLDRGKADQLASMFYTPFYRKAEEDAKDENNAGSVVGPKLSESLTNVKTAFDVKLKGGVNPLGDLFENMLRNADVIMKAGMKNVAMQQAAETMEAVGLGRGVKDREAGKTITYRVNGQDKNFEVDDTVLYATLAGAPREFSNGIYKTMSQVAGFFRDMITAAPSFMLANLWRGKTMAYVQEGLPFYTNTFGGLKQALQASASYKAIAAQTGFGGYTYGMGDRDIAKALERQIQGLGYGPGGMMRRAMGGLQKLSEATEMAERIKLYERMKAQGMTDKEAAYQAYLLAPFSRRGMGGGWVGSTVNWLVPLVPFLNAKIQGMYRLVENEKGDARVLKTIPRQMFLRGLVVMGASLALAGKNMADEPDRWNNETPDLKRGYDILYLPGGNRILFPRAFEVGNVFGTIPVFLLDAAVKGDGRDLAGMLASVGTSTFFFNPIPQAIVPILSVATNYDFFRSKPLENASDLGKLPGERVNRSTSSVARVIGENAGLSPIRIQALMEGYSGSIGTAVLAGFDSMLAGMGLIPGKPAGAFGDPLSMPAVIAGLTGANRFYRNDDQVASRFVSDFYRVKEMTDQLVRSRNDAVRSNDRDRLQELRGEAGLPLQLRSAVNTASTQITNINQSIRRIEKGALSSVEKAEAIQPLITRRDRIAKRVVDRAVSLGVL